MQLRATPVTSDRLRNLPTPARRVVDGTDVLVPEGFEVQPVVVGLSFPCGMGFADDGRLFILEGGSTWPTRPYMPSRVLCLEPSGELTVVGIETLGGPRGVAWREGAIYVSDKGGYHTRIVKYDLQRGERSMVVDGLPNGGWHEPGGPVFSPRDGLMYFAQGSVSQNGVILPQGYTVDMAKHPLAHDVPGQDVTLTGNNVWSRNPLAPYPLPTETGPFKPFGNRAEQGEVVKGQLKCSSGLWRARPDGSQMELLAWGLRSPYGMAFSEDGELYVSDNNLEEKGERAVAEDPDRIWHIKNAALPHGTVTEPEWYGFPDLCADGLPVWDERHLPQMGTPAEPLLVDPPPWAGPAAFIESPHSCMTKLDFCHSDAFGYRGKLFVCEWGSLAPLNSPREHERSNGFRVIAVDLARGTSEIFVRNAQLGPASAVGGGGLERPVDCKFHPDGTSLYVLDFGVSRVTRGYMWSFAHTGVLWRINRAGGRS